MSFILDALKKSETERARQSGPALLEARVVPRARGVPLWATLIGIVLLANLALLGWVLLRKDKPRDTGVPPAAAVAAPVAAPVQVTPAAPVPAPAPAQAPAAVAESRLLPPLPEPAAPAEAARVTEVNPADYQPAQPPERRAPAPAAHPQADETSIAADGALPTAADLAGIGVPELRLALHVYDANPANRYVLVNSQRAREGDTLNDGVRVERIDPQAVILSFRGRRFRLLPGG